MFKLEIKKNKIFSYISTFKDDKLNLNDNKVKSVRGFTLVETMVAVFILSMIIISLMAVVSNSLFASRYSRDEITANYLLQEAIDYIRNDRDTSVFLVDEINDETWSDFIKKYQNCSDNEEGCYIDVFTSLKDPYILGNIKKCDLNSNEQTSCPPLYFNANPDNYFYNYDGQGVETKFRRKISFVYNPLNTDEVIVTATVFWTSGSLSKSRSLQISLLKW